MAASFRSFNVAYRSQLPADTIQYIQYIYSFSLQCLLSRVFVCENKHLYRLQEKRKQLPFCRLNHVETSWTDKSQANTEEREGEGQTEAPLLQWTCSLAYKATEWSTVPGPLAIFFHFRLT